MDKRQYKILSEGESNIGGVFKTDLENGPSNHGKRALGNWQSDNAWDVFAPAGSVVNSYTDGTVKKVRDTGSNSGKIFGTQVTVTGGQGYPDIFYTHLRNVKLKAGDVVKVGDRIGEVSDWVGHDKITHVHIGLPKGKHLRDLLKNSKAIFSGNGGSSTPPSGDEKSDSTTGETSSSTSSIDEPKPSGGGSLTDFFRSMYQNLKSAGLGQTQLKEIHEDVDRITDIMKKIL